MDQLESFETPAPSRREKPSFENFCPPLAKQAPRT
jgi:hypothetical protein